MEIINKFNRRADAVNSLVCVGLDTDAERIPAEFQSLPDAQFAFNRWIIDQTHAHAAAFKLNIAFYEARGEAGWRELRLTADYLRANYPDVMTICDAKRADIGSTNAAYVRAIFDDLGFDAITLHPYVGHEALAPFLARTDKVSIILCRTSNPGAGELQDLQSGGKPLWQLVAERVSRVWNANGNCMLVVGATYPDELRRVRAVTGEMTFLVPGIGAQGGSVQETVQAGLNKAGKGLIINSSRAIIFANDPGAAARSLRDSINQHR
jgi:orotidine-5'-phosphate decarboxylase